MRNIFSALFTGVRDRTRAIQAINEIRSTLSGESDEFLRVRCQETDDLNEVIAVTAVTAERVLGLRMFDVQLEGALALADGSIAEMQTGEGKTLAAAPAVIWLARARRRPRDDGQRLPGPPRCPVDGRHLPALGFPSAVSSRTWTPPNARPLTPATSLTHG